MASLSAKDLDQLISVESHVHYGEAPPPGLQSFVLRARSSGVLLSAPHGARTRRDSADEEWHEEDEYTAAMALLLSEVCSTSVIATIWRTDDSDPNFHEEDRSPYKQAMRRVVRDQGIRWVIDLHGASEGTTRMEAQQLVDLGTRKQLKSLPDEQLAVFESILEANLGKGRVSRNRFPAEIDKRAITAFSNADLSASAVQVEMKPAVRIPVRRVDASSYATEGPYAADPKRIFGMMQALVDFIEYLHSMDK